MNNKQSAYIVEAKWLIENKATIRQCGEHFGVSKSCLYQHVTDGIREFPYLWEQVNSLLQYNKSQRGVRGGAATKAKYLGQSSK